MYNQFLYKQLVFTAALTLSAISAISSQHSDLYEDRALDLLKACMKNYTIMPYKV